VRAFWRYMKYACPRVLRPGVLWLGCLLIGGILSAGTQDSEFNVNSRYTVETVSV